jgi:ectoine hydroxylase-related dioxygenase (phytanoyl-CoA dioxygenase family)
MRSSKYHNILARILTDQSGYRRDVRPLLEHDTEWTGNFFPKETRRAYGMLGVSRTYATNIVGHPIYQATARKFLTQKHWFWEGSRKVWAVSKPQLNNTIVFSIAPGAKPQPLHRDDSVHHSVPEPIGTYPQLKGHPRDFSLGFFVAAKKSTKGNGATRFIPGSHLWGHEQEPDESLVKYAEMEKGDAFLMLSSCFHAGSANTTADQERLIFSTLMTRGTLRQEENQYLALDRQVMRDLPVEIQKIAGYSISEPNLGWVNMTDPLVTLGADVVGNVDYYGGTDEPELDSY